MRGGLSAPSAHHFFLCLLALRRLRYLCLDIFLRLFLISEPIYTSVRISKEQAGKPVGCLVAASRSNPGTFTLHEPDGGQPQLHHPAAHEVGS